MADNVVTTSATGSRRCWPASTLTMPGYRLTGTAHGSALLATACVSEQPLVTIGVAAPIPAVVGHEFVT